MTKAIQPIEPGMRAVAEANTVKELAFLAEIAEAAKVFYRAQDETEKANHAQEVKLRALQKAGLILLPTAQGGGTPRERGFAHSSGGLTNGGTPYQQVLEEAGVSRQAASEWQKLARVKEEDFDVAVANLIETAEGPTIAGVLREAGSWYGRSDQVAWETPQALFDLLDEEFHFSLDVCALPDNAKCKKFYSPKDDGLMQTWRGHCWMNPPYGTTIIQWMQKARESADKGATVVCLVPARTDTEWWWTTCPMSEIRFIRGRLQFVGSTTAAPFPSAVVVMQPNQKGKVVWWIDAAQLETRKR